MKKKILLLIFLALILAMILMFIFNKRTPTYERHAPESKCFTSQSEWEIYPLEINGQDVYASFLSTPVPTFPLGFTPEPPPSYIPSPPPITPNLSPMTPEESEEYAISQQLVDLDVSLGLRNIIPMSEFEKYIWCPKQDLGTLKKEYGFDAIGFSSRICGSDKTFKATYWSGVIHTIEWVKEEGKIKKICHENEYRILPNTLYIGYFIDSQGQKIQAVFEAKNGNQPNIPEAGEGVFNITMYFMHLNKEYYPMI